MAGLTDEQLQRYSRHIILKEIGYQGQKKLLESKILIIGAGGLGSPAALYLAAAGVGTIGIVDADVVDVTNLQRQVIHTTADVGRPKVESAAEKMRAVNPDVNVITYHEFVDSGNILDLVSGYDFVVDATDNFAAKFLINDACVMAGTPFVHAGVVRFEGQVMTVIPKQTLCYRCVFETPPPAGEVPTCREVGVIGAAVGVIGSFEALEAIKYVTGAGRLLTNRMLTVDALSMNVRVVPLPERGEGCAVCSDHPTITTLIDYVQPACDFTPGGTAGETR